MTAQVITRLQPTDLPLEAAKNLRSAIVSGRLKPNERLVERDIAGRLGISRTPLREAFLQLQRDGLVTDHHGRGLLVSRLSVGEITGIYQALAALERAALLATPEVSQTMLERLSKASRRRARSKDVLSTIGADLEWHRTITGMTPNARILQMLEPLRALAERYERAFFGRRENLDRSMAEHCEIESTLAEGNLKAAADLIEAHWLNNIGPMAAVVSAAEEGGPR